MRNLLIAGAMTLAALALSPISAMAKNDPAEKCADPAVRNEMFWNGASFKQCVKGLASMDWPRVTATVQTECVAAAGVAKDQYDKLLVCLDSHLHDPDTTP